MWKDFDVDDDDDEDDEDDEFDDEDDDDDLDDLEDNGLAEEDIDGYHSRGYRNYGVNEWFRMLGKGTYKHYKFRGKICLN